MLRLEHARKNMVCAMKCGVAPSQPTYEHHSRKQANIDVAL